MDCSICLDSIIENQKTVECGHTFHKDCILKWADNFNWFCPLCRQQIFIFQKSKLIIRGDIRFYPILFDNQKYIVEEKDYLEVISKLDLIETDNEEYINLRMTIILFSIMKSSSLDAAVEKIKDFFKNGLGWI